MISKTVGAILVILICIIMFPVAIGLLGGAFGIVIGVFGAVFGAFAGIFGAIFGVFEWMFDSLFNWHGPFHFFRCNIFTFAAIVLVVALLVKNRQNSRQ